MSSSASSYQTIIPGKLQLKGSKNQSKFLMKRKEIPAKNPTNLLSSSASTIKKSTSESKEEEKSLQSIKQIESKESVENLANKKAKIQENSSPLVESSGVSESTAAEKALEAIQQKLHGTLAANKIHKSHRETISEFNAKLAKLSDLHDVPRVCGY
jgi:protein FAM32A